MIGRLVLAAVMALAAASPTFAAVPQYVEGEAIVMMRTDEARAEVDSYAARSASNAASGSAASELGAVVVRNFLPVKAAAADSECLENDGRVGAARALSANGDERGGETYAVAQLRSASGESTEEFIERLRGDPRVVSAMPNYIMRLSSPARIVSAEEEEIEIAEPNDPLYGEQWGLERINMPAVWAQTAEAESEEVVVAVIDTGIIYDHEDLADNMYEFDADTLSSMGVAGIDAAKFAGSHGAWFHSSAEFGENEDEAPVTSAFDPIPVGPGAGTTKLASIDDVLSVTSDSRYVGDVEGHGTHVAGIIGAVTDNAIGIAGIAQNVKLMAVPVFSAFIEDGAAADGEFKIYNKDWSSFGGTFDGEAYYNVVLYIADNGPYDLDGAEGTITDPTAIVRYGAQKQSVSGGSGGGCSAGGGAIALLGLPFVYGLMRKFRKKGD